MCSHIFHSSRWVAIVKNPHLNQTISFRSTKKGQYKTKHSTSFTVYALRNTVFYQKQSTNDGIMYQRHNLQRHNLQQFLFLFN